MVDYYGGMFERFTDRARRVLVLAQEEAALLNHDFIGTEHILLGLIHERDGIAAKALQSLGISLEAVREKVQETIGPASAPATGSPPFTPRAKKVLELSLREALQLGHSYIGTEHMLLGLIREGEGVAAQVLVNLGGDLSRVRQQVIHLLGSGAGRASTAKRTSPAAAAAVAKAATLSGSSPTTTGHLLSAILADSQSQAAKALAALKVTADHVTHALAAVRLEDTSDAPPQPQIVEIKLGETARVIADPGLAEALNQITDEQLHDALRKAIDDLRRRPPEAEAHG
jgi:ATP-dependent Clp protease ATP-binding subunit ClpA